MPGPHPGAIALQGGLHAFADFRVFAHQEAFACFYHRHCGAQAGKSLAQLTANRPATQHHDACGQRGALRELAPQGVAGGVAHVLQARQVRHHRLRPRGNHDGAGVDALRCLVGPGHFHGPRVDDAGVALHHIHPQCGVTLYAVMRRDAGNHLLHARHHRRKIQSRCGCQHAKLRCAAHLVGDFGAVDQRFAGHAAKVQAVAAQCPFFHQGDFGLRRGGDIGRHQPPRACAYDHQVGVELTGPLSKPWSQLVALLQAAQDVLGRGGQQRHQQACHHQYPKNGGTQHSACGAEGCELLARTDIDHRAGEHADLADQVKRAGAHAGQPHEQVDQPKGYDRYQPQAEQVQRPFAFNMQARRQHPWPHARAQQVGQQVARQPERHGGPHRGGKRHQKHAPRQAQDGTGCHREHRNTGHRECGQQQIDPEKGGASLPG